MKRVPVDPSTLVPASSIERIVVPNNAAGRELLRTLIEARAQYLAKRRAQAEKAEAMS